MLIGLGLVLVIEGLLYALCADGMKRMLLSLVDVPPATLRTAGLVAAIAGMLLIGAARMFFNA